MKPVIEPKRMVAAAMKLQASTWHFDGRDDPFNRAYLNRCRRLHQSTGTLLIYTRDSGHHTSGWFKNPDYERCRHLSLSFIDPGTGEPRPRDPVLTRMWLDEFFSNEEQRLLWGEPPASLEGRRRGVWHYRLFCDDQWQGIKPRGEVYSTEFTERGWKSYRELWDLYPEPISPLYPG